MTIAELIDQIRTSAMTMTKAERAALAEALFALATELMDGDVEGAAKG